MKKAPNKLVPHRAAWLAVEFFAAAITFSFAFSTTGARQSPSPQIDAAERITLPGLPNAARVSGSIYRGAQPSPEGFPELKKLGIAVVVDFRDDREEIQREKTRVITEGMAFVSIPWNARNNPSRDNVVAFFTTLHDNFGKKIFIHCERGADRTGTMIALYRITYDHWTPDQAVAEMNAFHYWNNLFPNLARYVQAFPAAVSADPSLTGQAITAPQH
jgi:protein tyrosine/serine phosphatase